MKSNLLCTFTTQQSLNYTIDQIIDCYNVTSPRIDIFTNCDNGELMCIYDADQYSSHKIRGTISLHCKRSKGIFYTINALNYIRNHNLDWNQYYYSFLTVTKGEFKVNKIEYLKSITIKNTNDY